MIANEENLLLALSQVKRWECLGNPPKSDEASMALAETLLQICEDEEKLLWVVGRILQGATFCPKPIEIRRVYCKRYRPADGIEWQAADLTSVLTGEE